MKKLKEAIKHYKYGITHDIFSEPVTTYAKLSVDAINKQIKQKVLDLYKSKNSEDVEYNGEDTLYGSCPGCGHIVTDLWNPLYCGDCGQALEWDEEKKMIKHTFEFETEKDWKPLDPVCWVDCPISFMIGLGNRCKCIDGKAECPFVEKEN